MIGQRNAFGSPTPVTPQVPRADLAIVETSSDDITASQNDVPVSVVETHNPETPAASSAFVAMPINTLPTAPSETAAWIHSTFNGNKQWSFLTQDVDTIHMILATVCKTHDIELVSPFCPDDAHVALGAESYSRHLRALIELHLLLKFIEQVRNQPLPWDQARYVALWMNNIDQEFDRQPFTAHPGSATLHANITCGLGHGPCR